MDKKRREKMNKQMIRTEFVALVLAIAVLVPQSAFAGAAAEIDHGADLALEKLYASSPTAKEFSTTAKGVLVFPSVFKAGLIIGGHAGKGVLRKGGESVGYYTTLEASFGLQAGIQSFGYALFFMTDSAMKKFENSTGFEIGVGPSVVVVDKGVAGSLSTTTIKADIYAFFFNQQGLMGGLSLKGSKITKMDPPPE
jgi:lipid-binding SYLF domain-containing protein